MCYIPTTIYDYYYYSLYKLHIIRYNQRTITIGGIQKDCKINDSKINKKYFLLNLKSRNICM